MTVFVVLALVWLGFAARDYYRGALQGLLAGEFNWPAGVAFYLLFARGIVGVCFQPAMAQAG